jgi:hypothetical protein
MTELEAANKALTLLGVAPIDDLGEDIQAARVMNGLMESVRRAVLSEFPWSFALRLQPLIQSAEPAPPGWFYTFVYPDASAALYQVYDGRMTKIHYIVQDGVICTNRPAANVEYTVMVPLESWPNLAAEAFVARLASDAAASLAGSPQFSASLLEKYAALVSLAKTNSMNEEYVPHKRPTYYIDVRF